MDDVAKATLEVISCRLPRRNDEAGDMKKGAIDSKLSIPSGSNAAKAR